MSKKDQTETVYIDLVDLENVKRIRVARLDVRNHGLCIIGGRNAQGKTSILDAIRWTLGGDRFRPDQPLRDGAKKLKSKITLSNGMVVSRGGAKGSLTVTAPGGLKGNQSVLNAFLSEVALDLSKFTDASNSERSKMLLSMFPELDERLQQLSGMEAALYQDRASANHEVQRLKAKLQGHDPDEPEPESVDLTELLEESRELRKEVDQARDDLRCANEAEAEAKALTEDIEIHEREIKKLEKEIADLKKAIVQKKKNIEQCKEDAANYMAKFKVVEKTDPKTRLAELETKIGSAEAVNRRHQQWKDARDLSQEYKKAVHAAKALSDKLEEIREKKVQAISDAQLPLDGLEIEDGELRYNGHSFDDSSGMEQLKMAVAICSQARPECGFVLVDDLEKMDMDNLLEFAEFLREHRLQAICARVCESDEVRLIIEDGELVDRDAPAEEQEPDRPVAEDTEEADDDEW